MSETSKNAWLHDPEEDLANEDWHKYIPSEKESVETAKFPLTKIVGTLGPNMDKETLRELALSGMNIFRMNRSHGDHEQCERYIKIIRELEEELGLVLNVMYDLKGTEIRTSFDEENALNDEGCLEMKAGVPHVFLVQTDDEERKEKMRAAIPDNLRDKIIWISHPRFADFAQQKLDEHPAEPVMNLENWEATLTIRYVNTDMGCVVATPHKDYALSNARHVNVPDVEKEMDEDVDDSYLEAYEKGLKEDWEPIAIAHAYNTLTAVPDHDKKDIIHALTKGANSIFLSYVQGALPVDQTKKAAKILGREDVLVGAKIESVAGFENRAEIIEAADVIMIARGDLKGDCDYETELVPMAKQLADDCHVAGVPFIYATEVMASMENNSVPTAAELTDAYFAIKHLGAHAIMGSGEIAKSKDPVATVRTIRNIQLGVEESMRRNKEVFRSKLLHRIQNRAQRGPKNNMEENPDPYCVTFPRPYGQEAFGHILNATEEGVDIITTANADRARELSLQNSNHPIFVENGHTNPHALSFHKGVMMQQVRNGFHGVLNADGNTYDPIEFRSYTDGEATRIPDDKIDQLIMAYAFAQAVKAVYSATEDDSEEESAEAGNFGIHWVA